MKKYIGCIVALCSIAFSGTASANTQTGFNSSNRQYFDGDPYFNAPIAGVVNLTALQGSASAIQVSPSTAFRFKSSQLATSLTGSVSTATYQLSANVLNQGMMLDWSPSQRFPLKISAGLYQNGLNAVGIAKLKNNINVSTKVTKNVTTKVAGQAVTQAVTKTVTTVVTPQQVGNLDVAVNYTNSVAPYFGFGWSNAYMRKKLTMSFDAGVVYVGNIDVSVSSKNTQYASNLTVQDRINQQATQIENNYSAKYIPTATFAVTYRF